MLNGNYDVKTMDCKKNYKELLSSEYAIMKLFVKRFDTSLFCAKYISGILYKLGLYGEKFKGKKMNQAIEDLKLIHGDKAIDMVNSPTLMGSINIGQIIHLNTKTGKINVSQMFPASERNVLRMELSNGSCFKMLTFPLAIGGYLAWDKKSKLYAVIPTKAKSGKYNFSLFLKEVMELDVDSDEYNNDLETISKEYSSAYEMIRVDRVKKEIYTRNYSKVSGKYIVSQEVKECNTEDDNDSVFSYIGSSKAEKDNGDEMFITEI